MILALFALVFGCILMWILAWLTATPVRVVRAALNRVEQGDLDTNLVVFDGTELGQLQRGFNSMVAGLRERERVRDLFGNTSVARSRRSPRRSAPTRRRGTPRRGDIRRHHRLDTARHRRPAVEVVELLNRFFAVVVDEVDRHHGLVNKFEGDAALAVFGAPGLARQAEERGAGGRPGDGRAAPRRGARVRGGHRRRFGGSGGRQRRRQGAFRVHRHRRAGQRGGPAVRAGQEVDAIPLWRHPRQSRTPARPNARSGRSARQ